MPASAARRDRRRPLTPSRTEIAREADLDGTLVVLVGNELGAWSNEIGDARLGELVSAVRAN